MTSNVGTRKLKEFGTGVGFNTSAKLSAADEHAKGVITNALKKSFAPEFLNRIDDVILFNSLSKEDIHKIIDIELAKLFSRVHDLGFKIQLTNEAKDYIANKGYDKEYGARPLKRAIQKYLEDTLAEEILTSKLSEGDTVKVDFDEKNSEIKMKVTKAKKKAAKKEDEDAAE